MNDPNPLKPKRSRCQFSQVMLMLVGLCVLSGCRPSTDEQAKPSEPKQVELSKEQQAIDSFNRDGDHAMIDETNWEASALAGQIAYQQGRYGDAAKSFKMAIEEAEKSGVGDERLAGNLNGLAIVYRAQAKYAEAESLYRRALAIQEKALGPEHLYVGMTLNNLAGFFYVQGKYAEAEPLYRRTLAIYEKTWGPENPDVAMTFDNLAGVCLALGNDAEAERLYHQALSIMEKAWGPEDPELAKCLNNLARLYHIQGKHTEAEPLYERSLAIGQKVLGPEHPDLAPRLHNLAILYGLLGKYAEAESLYKRSLAIYEKALGPEHPDVAMAHNELAWLYATCTEAGLRDGRKAVEHGTQACDLTRWTEANYLGTLGAAYAEAGQFEEAVKWETKAIELAASEYDTAAADFRLELYKAGKPYREEPEQAGQTSGEDRPDEQ
ncbi:tetratricopeptide repeat protein [Planctomycetota bacterium]